MVEKTNFRLNDQDCTYIDTGKIGMVDSDDKIMDATGKMTKVDSWSKDVQIDDASKELIAKGEMPVPRFITLLYNDTALKAAVQEKGLPEGSTWDDVSRFDNAVALKEAIKEKGLPEDSTWGDINRLDNAAALKEAIKEKGLPEGSTWDDVSRFDQAVALKEATKERGLPERSTWGDINRLDNDAALKEAIAEYGLPENSTWTDVVDFMIKK